MNLASWIILAIVVAIIILAIRATFFKKSAKGGCCDTGSPDTSGKGGGISISGACSACSSCPSCSSCMAKKD
jgi:hypothetical protein